MFQKVLRVSYVPCKQIQSKTDEFIKYSGVWWGCLTLSLRFFSVQQVLFYLVFLFFEKESCYVLREIFEFVENHLSFQSGMIIDMHCYNQPCNEFFFYKNFSTMGRGN